jgi:hypothetical protein
VAVARQDAKKRPAEVSNRIDKMISRTPTFAEWPYRILANKVSECVRGSPSSLSLAVNVNPTRRASLARLDRAARIVALLLGRPICHHQTK